MALNEKEEKIIDAEIVSLDEERKKRKHGPSRQQALEVLSQMVNTRLLSVGVGIGITQNQWYKYEAGRWFPIKFGDNNHRQIEGVIKDACLECGLHYAQDDAIVWRTLSLDSRNWIPDDALNETPMIAFRNGTLDVLSGEFLRHDPNHYTTRYIDADYHQKARAEHWPQILNEMLSNYSKDDAAIVASIIQEWMGMALAAGGTTRLTRPMRRALFLYGPPNAGKSLVLGLIGRVLGGSGTTSSSIKQVNSRFGLERFVDAWAWICEETGALDRGVETSTIKALITGERLTADRKGIPAIDFVFNGAVAWAGNSIPRFGESSGALYSRLIFVPFTRVFTEQESKARFGNDQPVDWLLKRGEVPGIVNWALEGLRRLLERGHYQSVPALDDSREDMREGNDPAFAFVRECCEHDATTSNSADILAYALMAHASQGGDVRNTPTKQQARKDIRSVVGEQMPNVVHERIMIQGVRSMSYKGLRLNAVGLAAWHHAKDRFPMAAQLGLIPNQKIVGKS